MAKLLVELTGGYPDLVGWASRGKREKDDARVGSSQGAPGLGGDEGVGSGQGAPVHEFVPEAALRETMTRDGRVEDRRGDGRLRLGADGRLRVGDQECRWGIHCWL
ncbi:hypothetical protein ACFX15_046596 [Malus domestica]